jgi:disulfide oxidoreductase YuzD
MNKNFCIAPFVCTRQNAYDRISPCAFGPVEVQVSAADNQVARWRNPEIEKLRSKFLNGDKPSECKRCWDEEDANVQSLRLRTLDTYPTAYKTLVETGKWKDGPLEIVIKTSNVCNLACRSCAGWDSSYYWPEGKFYKDTYQTTQKVLGIIKQSNQFVQKRDKVYHSAKLWTNKDLSNVFKINFFGGEPLLDKEHPKLLQRIVDSGRAHLVTLFYSTNCQQRASKKLVNLWSHFKKLEIFFSVDGMDEQFSYLRWPGDWTKTKKNIDWFLTFPKKYPKVEWYFQGSQCVSIYNIASYWHTAEWLKSKLGNVYFNIVDHPNYLRMTILPEHAKQQIKDSIPDDYIRHYLLNEPTNHTALRQMIIWTKRQDLYRNQDFTKVFPETYALIKDHWDRYSDLSDSAFWSD